MKTWPQTRVLEGTFPLFLNLPTELRHRIWELALLTTPMLIPHSIARVPAIAYVCQESNYVFKQHHTLVFHGNYDKQVGLALTYPMALCANLARDILFISWDLFRDWNVFRCFIGDWMSLTEYENVKHIAIDAWIWRQMDPDGGRLVEEWQDEIEMGIDYRDIFLLGFSKLETLSLVLDNDVDHFGRLTGISEVMECRSVQTKMEQIRTRDLRGKEIFVVDEDDVEDFQDNMVQEEMREFWKVKSVSSISIQIPKVQLVRVVDVDEQKVKG
ncbi:hypothetical protein BDZ45DRAFT_748862 [Acephala macrosclerotiorum]|nr:hypothetical protein BDZ45DRAFT_748862 [Acephala macrosclerotiorum]